MPTEVQIIAAQDQALAVRAIKHHIYGMSVPVTCRLCGDAPEYIDHLLSGCSSIAATMYKQRHDSVAKIIHWALSRQFDLAVPTHYWNHVQQSVSENSRVKLLWDFNVYTDHVLSARRPDVVVMNKEEASVQIIDIAVPADCNITSKEAEKEKYRDLSIELMSLWKRKCEIIPIVVGCLGCVTHMLESNLKKLSVFNLFNVELLQRTALLGSSFVLCRYL